MILELYKEIYKTDKLNKSNLEDLAERLSNIAHRQTPWGWKYLHSLAHGHKNVRASEKIIDAMAMLGATLDEQSPLVPLVREVRVFSVGGVEPGSIVLGDTIRCKNCLVRFVPNVPWRKYCTDECGKVARKLR